MIYKLLGVQRNRLTSPFRQQKSYLAQSLAINIIMNIIITFVLHYNLDKPYMDQIFHTDQMNEYLKNNFTYWNSKITTPPGQYFLNYLPVKYLIKTGFPLLLACRLLNSVVYNGISFFFMHELYARQGGPQCRPLLRTFTILLTPTIFFFNFLSYSDATSLTFILMSHYYTGHSGPRSLITGFIAISVRQTNIVWIIYSAIYHYISSRNVTLRNSPALIGTFLKLCWADRKLILYRYSWQLILVLIFLLAFRMNNYHIVLGDHQNHQFSFHLVQICYLSLFIMINAPISWSQTFEITKLSLSRILFNRNACATAFLISSCLIVIIDKFTLWHPFVYSDNRHYTFYLYKDIFKNMKFIFVPVYVVSMICGFRLIVDCRLAILRYLLWLFCVSIVLIPAKLIQFRYFTVPLIMYSLLHVTSKKNIEQNEGIGFSKCIILRIAANAIFLYIFIACPFNKDDRFMF